MNYFGVLHNAEQGWVVLDRAYEAAKPQDLLRAALSYDPQTGMLHWKVSTGRVKAGDVAGSRVQGYVQVRLGRVRYYAHRVAWLFSHGAWPCGEIDHINGIRDDNRIVNLRDVSTAINRQNLRSPPRTHGTKSGFLGVWVDEHNRFGARITVGGKTHHLGMYGSPQEAHDAYVSAKRRLHPGGTL